VQRPSTARLPSSRLDQHRPVTGLLLGSEGSIALHPFHPPPGAPPGTGTVPAPSGTEEEVVTPPDPAALEQTVVLPGLRVAEKTIEVPCQPLASPSQSAGTAETSSRPPQRERRGGPRWICDLEARCLARPPREGETWLSGRVRSLSAGGLLFVGPNPGLHRVLVVEVRNGTGRIACLLLARVVRAQPAPQGHWALSCKLETRLTDQQLKALLL
jgi:hypothetical protein